MQLSRHVVVFLWSVVWVVVACILGCSLVTSLDGLSNGPVAAEDAGPSLFAVRGTVDGLGAAHVTLVINGTNPLTVSGAGVFAFPRDLADGAVYFVTVVKDPPGHVCSVRGGTGRIMRADATDVVVHCPSTNARLSGLSVSGAVLAPEFAPATEAYAAALTMGPFSTDATTTVIATAADPGARIRVAGVSVSSGSPSAPLALKYGPNPIDITVTAASGKDQTRYAIVINRRASDYVKASNARTETMFGDAVAISGDTLAVGALREDSGAAGINGDQSNRTASGAGAVYIFTRVGAIWKQQAYIKASNARVAAFFGAAVALSGDTLAVGAEGESSNATGVNGNQADVSMQYAGAAYVFTRSGTVWTQQAYIKASTARTFLGFGRSVALSGETLAIGAPGESSSTIGINGDQADTGAYASGAAYVFTRAGAVWTQQAYIKASNTRAFAAFGGSVALSGDTLTVGSPSESSSTSGVNGSQADTGTSDAGAAYVFTRAGGTWTQQAYVKASNTRANVSFGRSVALSGDTLAVSGWREGSSATGVNGDQTDTTAPSAGAVYLFARNGATWAQQAYVKASNARGGALFGSSLALSNDTLAVGAIQESSGALDVDGDQADTSKEGAGAVYLFTRAGAAWSQRMYVKASNTRTGANFGSSVAVAPQLLAVGSSAESSGAKGVNGDQTSTSTAGAGAVYVFP